MGETAIGPGARPIGVALVGLGWRGTGVGAMLKQQSQFRLVRAVDVDLQAADAFASSQDVPVSDKLDSLLADGAVQAVILTTPHSVHEEQVKRLASVGKHVFCEKPLGMTRASALRSVEACRSGKVVLGIGHERRFEPPMLELRRMITEGDLGTLLQIEANFSHDTFVGLDKRNWRRSPHEAPVAGMTGRGLDLLDLSVSMLGKVDRVVAYSATLATHMPAGDTMATIVRFKSGATAYISAMLATPFISRFQIFGSRGWVEIRDKAEVEAPQGWVMTRCLAGGRPEVREFPAANAVLTNLRAFANAIDGTAPYPIPHDDMVDNIAAMEAIIRSAERGGEVVLV